jgi:peptidoglycan/xylan/chitin deacetylase (PgdA/CDA1 family)
VVAGALGMAGAGVVAWELEERAWSHAVTEYDIEVAAVERTAADSRAQAETAYSTHLEALTAAINEGEPVYERSEGQVAEPAVREPLEIALDDAATLASTEVTYPTSTRTVDALDRTNPFRPGTRPAVVAEVVDGSVPAPADLDAATVALVEATDAVAQAHRQWAYDGLEEAAAEGRPVLSESADRVTDEGTRTTLQEALGAATTTLRAGVDAVDPSAAVDQSEAVHDATEAVWADRLARILDARRGAAVDDGIDCRVEACVALTFDDGPVADTERLLRILDRKKVTATFFWLGSNVERRPELARSVVDAGHLVANHSWDHPQLTTLDDDEIRDQLDSTQEAIDTATGFTPFLLRPPYGDVDDDVRSIATRSGLQTVLWTLDSEDWRLREADKVVEHVMDQVEPGSNVLLHDIHSETVDAVGDLVDALRDEDYLLVTVDQLAEPEEGT